MTTGLSNGAHVDRQEFIARVHGVHNNIAYRFTLLPARFPLFILYFRYHMLSNIYHRSYRFLRYSFSDLNIYDV